MSATALRRPFAPLALAAALLAAAFVLLPSGAASAHDSLVSTDPAADSAVETLPEELTLTFSGALIDAPDSTAVAVMDASGKSLAEGTPEIDGAILTQPLNTEGASAGEYTVLWQVVSSDGHPTDGSFTFTVTTGSAGAEPDPVESEAPAETAAPEATQTISPTVTQEPDAQDSSPASAWIWVISIAGILVAAAVAVWLAVRGRRSGSDSGSDTPAEG